MSVTKDWRAVLAQATSPAFGGGVFTVTRAAGHRGEMVFVEDGHDILWMTREQAADLGETLMKVSGMATSTRGAVYLAEVVGESLLRKGITKARVCAEAGMTRYRLRRLLSASTAMTQDELEAISNIGSDENEVAK